MRRLESHGDPTEILRQPITFILADAAECAARQFHRRSKVSGRRARTHRSQVYERESARGVEYRNEGREGREGKKRQIAKREGTRESLRERDTIKRKKKNLTTKVEGVKNGRSKVRGKSVTRRKG